MRSLLSRHRLFANARVVVVRRRRGKHRSWYVVASSSFRHRVLTLLRVEDVAYAIQYAVIYQYASYLALFLILRSSVHRADRFLKYVDHLQTREAAREYIVYGVTAEAEWINAHKGTSLGAFVSHGDGGADGH